MSDARSLVPSVLLGVAFLAIVVVGIVTVLVPELSGDSEVDEGASPTGAEEPSPSGDTPE
jgi:hypothetical protein